MSSFSNKVVCIKISELNSRMDNASQILFVPNKNCPVKIKGSRSGCLFALKLTNLTLAKNYFFYRLFTGFTINYTQAVITGRDVIDLKIIARDPHPLSDESSTHVC